MTLAEELLEFANDGMMQGEVEDDNGLVFDNAGEEPANLEYIFNASGFRRGMREINKVLVRSGGDTDL